MRTTKRGAKGAALAVGLALIATACGSSSKSTSTAAPATTSSGSSTTAGATTTAGSTTTSGSTKTSASAVTSTTTVTSTSTVTTGSTGGGGTGKGMKLTIDINPKAVWDDGSPITEADFKCLYDATLHTTGSVSTVGYDQITSVDKGTSDKQVVVNFKTVYAPYKNLFSNILKAAAFKDCNELKDEMQSSIPFSGRPYKQQSWSADQQVLVPNDKYWGTDKPIAKKIVMVPKTDTDTELASLKAGEVDFIFPQAASGIADALKDPNIKSTPGYGTNYEALWFQQKTGPFADAAFRQGFAHYVDRDLILKNVYDPLFPGGPLLDCGTWVPNIGKWCDQTAFKGYTDAAKAEKALTAGGYAKNADGMWAKAGKVPHIRWMINAGNKRRENAQALLLPEFKKLGFDVVADNCDAACVFQKRLPTLDYDLGMYIQTASPDPTVTTILACASIPSDANGGNGQNNSGWCNKDADALMTQSDTELDTAKRETEIHKLAKIMADDAVMVPLYQFPNIAAWRTDKLSGPIDADAANYQAWQNIDQWKPASGDQITVGAEQWPDCVNVITQCANSSWMVWTTAFKVLPNVWDTTSAGSYKPTELVTGEPKVQVL